MIPMTKTVIMTNQVSGANASTTTGRVDTLGFDFCLINCTLTTSDNTSNNASVFTLSESDDTVVTNFTAFSTGDTDWTVPTHSTSLPFVVQYNLDLRGRRRFLRLTMSPLTTIYHCCIASLSRGTVTPIGITKAAVDVQLNL